MNIQNIHIYKKNTKISLNTNLLKKFNSINLHLYTHVYLYYYQYILLYNNHLLYIYLFSKIKNILSIIIKYVQIFLSVITICFIYIYFPFY
jgi:hypothetical protein